MGRGIQPTSLQHLRFRNFRVFFGTNRAQLHRRRTKFCAQEIFKEESQNFRMDQEELPSDRITVVIRLTSAQHIDAIKNMLAEILPDFECLESGTVITVSGYPPDKDFGTNTVLAMAQTHDADAVEET